MHTHLVSLFWNHEAIMRSLAAAQILEPAAVRGSMLTGGAGPRVAVAAPHSAHFLLSTGETKLFSVFVESNAARIAAACCAKADLV